MRSFGAVVSAGLWESVIVSFIAATVAYWGGFLTVAATIAAAILGGIILFFGGWDWAAATAGSFFITALLSQRHDRAEINASTSAKTQRNLKQVLANGLLLALIAVLHHRDDGNGVFLAAYLGCVGAVAGDTWATSAAQFSAADPRMLTSGRRVPAGTPGAVTGIGIALTALAGFVASALYVSATILFGNQTTPVPVIILGVAATIGALAGSLFDSYLGAAWQALYIDSDYGLTDRAVGADGSFNTYVRGWRWLSNDLVNFSNAAAGALSAHFVWAAAVWLQMV